MLKKFLTLSICLFVFSFGELANGQNMLVPGHNAVEIPTPFGDPGTLVVEVPPDNAKKEFDISKADYMYARAADGTAYNIWVLPIKNGARYYVMKNAGPNFGPGQLRIAGDSIYSGLYNVSPSGNLDWYYLMGPMP